MTADSLTKPLPKEQFLFRLSLLDLMKPLEHSRIASSELVDIINLLSVLNYSFSDKLLRSSEHGVTVLLCYFVSIQAIMADSLQWPN